MKTVEEFQHDGKQFIYIDFSGCKTNTDYKSVIEAAKAIVVKYPKNSLYSITDGNDVTFDSLTKEMVTEWMKFAGPYVIHGALIGINGIKKIMINSMLKISGRTNLKILNSKQEAIEWLSKNF